MSWLDMFFGRSQPVEPMPRPGFGEAMRPTGSLNQPGLLGAMMQRENMTQPLYSIFGAAAHGLDPVPSLSNTNPVDMAMNFTPMGIGMGTIKGLPGPVLGKIQKFAGANPKRNKAYKMLERSLLESGDLTVDTVPVAREALSEIAQTRAERSGWKTIDPLVKAKSYRPVRLERMKEQEKVATAKARLNDMPIVKSWNKKMREEVEQYIGSAEWRSYADRAAQRATLEAVVREARKRGWNVRHTSAGRNKRASSRYIEVPGRGEVRLSDHGLPQADDRPWSIAAQERTHRATAGQGPRWVDDVVVDDANWSNSLDWWMDRLSGKIEE